MDTTENIAAVRWFDNKAVNLVCSFVGAEPTDIVKRYDRRIRAHVDVPTPITVKLYNSFMGGIG